jgi:dihydrofolate reductase
MSELIVVMSMTLDGVTQAPGRPDEDERGGFRYGGWAQQYNDPVAGQEMGKGMASTGAILLGRRTYQDFYSYWPRQRDNPYTDVLNETPKYVASRTLTGPLPWQNSTLLDADVVTAVARLKIELDAGIAVLGSGELVRSLAQAGLVDRYVLLIHPLVLGTGRRLFADGTPYTSLELVSSVPTTTGVVIATYRPVQEDAR